MQLLAPGKSNAKLEKSNELAIEMAIRGLKKYVTFGLSLYPDPILCPKQEQAGCTEGCLRSAGHGNFPNVIKARKAKAELFHKDRKTFMMILRGELAKIQIKCQKKGEIPVVRLNVISDVNWFKVVEEFPDIQFYDYTKVGNRSNKVLPSNYHLTYSYSEHSEEYLKSLEHVWDTDNNIAVVFRTKIFPKTFKGRKVIDGDKHDMRFLDEKRVVVGLSAKGSAKKDTSGFVIDTISKLINL
jgi:hypothetical protein